MPNGKHHRVLIVGGGTAGITVAAICDAMPATWISRSLSPSRSIITSRRLPWSEQVSIRWRKPIARKRVHTARRYLDPRRGQEFRAGEEFVRLHNGDALTYEYLVVCTGVRLDWDKVIGLAETLGTNGVCSNYSPTSVNYTWECVQKLKPGDKIICT